MHAPHQMPGIIYNHKICSTVSRESGMGEGGGGKLSFFSACIQLHGLVLENIKHF